jgi:hypothetical protein
MFVDIFSDLTITAGATIPMFQMFGSGLAQNYLNRDGREMNFC